MLFFFDLYPAHKKTYVLGLPKHITKLCARFTKLLYYTKDKKAVQWKTLEEPEFLYFCSTITPFRDTGDYYLLSKASVSFHLLHHGKDPPRQVLPVPTHPQGTSRQGTRP